MRYTCTEKAAASKAADTAACRAVNDVATDMVDSLKCVAVKTAANANVVACEYKYASAATCTEKATTSVRHDFLACSRVTAFDLKDSTKCVGVKTQADASVAACDYKHTLSLLLDVAAVGGTIKLTPTATGITFEPSSVDVASGQTTSATFKATAKAGTAAGKASISVKLEGSATNIGKTPLTVSGGNAVTVVDGVRAVELFAAVSLVDGGTVSAAVSFTLDKAAVGGTIKLTPTATGITFEPTSVDVASGQTTSATFTVTANAGIAAGKASISVKVSGSASNAEGSTLTVSGGNAVMVVDGPSAATLSAEASIVDGGAASPALSFVLDVPAVGGAITLTPSATGIIFIPSSVVVVKGEKSSTTFKANSPSGQHSHDQPKSSISVAVTGSANNIGSKALTISGANSITLIDGPSAVSLSQSVSLVEGGAASSALSLTLDEAALGGTITLTPSAKGITFLPSSVTVRSGEKVSGTFTAAVAIGTSAGYLPIEVALKGSASNIGSTSLTVSGGNRITAVDGPTTISISKFIRIGDGAGKSIPVTFILDAAAAGGTIRLKPAATGITFSPATIVVASGAKNSATFRCSAARGITPGSRSIDVVLTGSATNIGIRTIAVSNIAPIIILAGCDLVRPRARTLFIFLVVAQTYSLYGRAKPVGYIIPTW